MENTLWGQGTMHRGVLVSLQHFIRIQSHSQGKVCWLGTRCSNSEDLSLVVSSQLLVMDSVCT